MTERQLHKKRVIIMNNEIIQCKICNYQTNNHQSFNSHISYAHHINSKEYYDSYIKTNEDGICKTCGKPTKFNNMWKGYRMFCSNSCMSSNSMIQFKRKQTSKIHYGVDFPHQSQEVKEKMSKTNIAKYGTANVYASDYGKQKIKQSMINHYGVDNAAKAESVKQKIKNTNLSKYGTTSPLAADSVKEKIKNTCLAKYGVEYSSQIVESRKKCKQTYLEKYGVDSILKLDSVRKRTYETAYTHEARSKARKTAKLKGNNSSLEDYLEQYFIDNLIEYKTEYDKDDRYPYHCDFYLPKYDMFIEINNYWTHNDHYFNENDFNDIQLLSKWKNKNTPQYNTAVYIWSIRDIEKRNTAIKNNLNYIVLWNKPDIDNFIKTFTNSFIK